MRELTFLCVSWKLETSASLCFYLRDLTHLNKFSCAKHRAGFRVENQYQHFFYSFQRIACSFDPLKQIFCA